MHFNLKDYFHIDKQFNKRQSKLFLRLKPWESVN